MNNDIKLRRATQQDREALCETERTAILTLGRSHYTEAEVDAWASGLSPERYEAAIADDYVVVAERDARVIGFGQLELDGEVAALYVRPELAWHGVGLALLEALQAEARRARLPMVYCKASLCAEAFYRRAGFFSGQRCKHRFRDGREIDCIPMTKVLT